jgi:ribosome maturation factor RimP
MNRSPEQEESTSHPHHHLIQLISPMVESLGYRVISLEVQSHRQKTLRIFIDYLDESSEKTIGIEDCVKVSQTLDEPLDQLTEITALFPGGYELEVSSPGVDRPLRLASDFERFAGREIRVHVYRPLTQEEIENPVYQEKNSKQKNFLGTLVGFQKGKVVLLTSSQTGKEVQKHGKKSKVKKNTPLTTNSVEGNTITIPLPLISKANLEPHFNFEESDERE